MQISLKTWNQYKNRLASIDKKAAEEMEAYIQRIGGFEDHAEEVIRYAYALASRYGEAAAAAACQMHEAVAEASGVRIPPAVPAEPPDYKEVARAVRGTVKNSSEKQIPRTVGRLVKRTGADTTLKNAERDGAQFAWIPMGDTCAFCLTLASRGWQHMSKNALKNGHAEHIHANCDCQYAIRFDDNTSIEGYDPDKYREMYDNAEGGTPKEKINSMRRMKYQENKRAAYAESKEKDGLTGNGKGGLIKLGGGGPKQLRIPQIPASTISKKVESGEYSLKLSQQSYDKHVEGTRTYEIYLRAREEKGLNPQSVLTISKEEAQDIIDRQSGTGIIKPRRDGSSTDIEQITCDRFIGFYYQKGEKIPTNKAAIHHGRRGSHIVPIKGNHYD